MAQALMERYADRIAGVLSCYDRLVITGTLPTVCYAEGMTRYLHARGIRIFDYPEFAKTLRERVRETAAALAAEAGVGTNALHMSRRRSPSSGQALGTNDLRLAQLRAGEGEGP